MSATGSTRNIADQLADAQELIRKKNAELNRLTADLRAQHRENDTAETIRRKIYGLGERSPDPPKWLIREGSKPGSPGTPIMIWSDWHFGEVVDANEVGGVNSFNPGICRVRVHRLCDRTIDIAYHHMGRQVKYPGAVICIGGDIISGDIHEELLATNAQTPHKSVEGATDILCAALETMAKKFGKLFVPCVVGNHGRSSKKPRMKQRVYTSYEWNIYCNLERYFRHSKAIQFFVSSETDVYFSVFGHRYLLTHGDSLGVKGGDGIIGAMGPIMRGAIKVGRSEAQIGRDFDTIVMGHWHQYLTFPGVIVNNSLKGYDEYARLKLRAPYSRPSQAFWFTHPKQGITAHWQVYLEDLKTANKASEWVTWQGTATSKE